MASGSELLLRLSSYVFDTISEYIRVAQWTVRIKKNSSHQRHR